MTEIEPWTSTGPEGSPNPCAGCEWFYLFIISGRNGGIVMDIVQKIVDIVNQVGFPIACVIAMFWQMEKERESHAAESTRWVEAINRNSSVIEKLTDRLGE